MMFFKTYYSYISILTKCTQLLQRYKYIFFLVKFYTNLWCSFVCLVIYSHILCNLLYLRCSNAYCGDVKVHLCSKTNRPTVAHKFSFILNIFVSFWYFLCALANQYSEQDEYPPWSGTESVYLLYFFFFHFPFISMRCTSVRVSVGKFDLYQLVERTWNYLK